MSVPASVALTCIVGSRAWCVLQLYDATQRYGEKIQAEWTLDIIKETVGRFDFDGDGKMNRDEFQAALDNLEMRKPSKLKTKDRRKSLQGSLKRA